MRKFTKEDLKKLYKPKEGSGKGTNGRVLVIGGSTLFHGAPLLALKTASRVVDMVFFASPEPSMAKVCQELKSFLSSFIWIPWEQVDDYIVKSDSILIGPGMMRYHGAGSEGGKPDVGNVDTDCDQACRETKRITEDFLEKYPDKQWVIDAGSLQTMEARFIPKGAILTPNRKEIEMLFGKGNEPFDCAQGKGRWVANLAEKYQCIIVHKNAETIIYSPGETWLVKGGNAGMVKGGTGDVLAGLTVALVAKNEPMLAASAASWIVKKAADQLCEKVGFVYNADDLADEVPKVLGKYFR